MTSQIDAIELLLRDHRLIDGLAEQLDTDDPAEIRRLCASSRNWPRMRQRSKRWCSQRSGPRSRWRTTTRSHAGWVSTRS